MVAQPHCAVSKKTKTFWRDLASATNGFPAGVRPVTKQIKRWSKAQRYKLHGTPITDGKAEATDFRGKRVEHDRQCRPCAHDGLSCKTRASEASIIYCDLLLAEAGLLLRRACRAHTCIDDAHGEESLRAPQCGGRQA